jgi:hypothetical protein
MSAPSSSFSHYSSHYSSAVTTPLPPVQCIIFNIRSLYSELQNSLEIPVVENLTQLREKEEREERERIEREKEREKEERWEKEKEARGEEHPLTMGRNKRSPSVGLGHGSGHRGGEDGDGKGKEEEGKGRRSGHSPSFLAYSFLLPWGHSLQLDKIIRSELRLSPPEMIITFGLTGYAGIIF